MLLYGTTSACAENTLKCCSLIFLQWNYLRVRGEYAQVLQPDILAMELPPRARRIPMQKTEQAQAKGTTSACAENTRGLTNRS